MHHPVRETADKRTRPDQKGARLDQSSEMRGD
jgi:hypothetical protein